MRSFKKHSYGSNKWPSFLFRAKAPFQRLSPVQEQRLTNWVLAQESLGLSPTHAQIRAFAGRILAARHDRLSLGKR